MPNSADLVTDLPADFNVFGQGVDTSMSQLLGGTTGQVLSKTSATNMAFTWVTPTDQTPLTTKGDLFTFTTVDARIGVGANETRLVADSAQATGLKYVADTTNYAINAKADLLVGTAADTLAALTVGTNGQVLTADSTVSPTGLKWATPAAGGGGKVLQVVFAENGTDTNIESATFTDTNLSATITPTSATSRIAIFATNHGEIYKSGGGIFGGMRLLRDATVIMTSNGDGFFELSSDYGKFSMVQNYVDSPATTSAVTYKTQGRGTTSAVRLRLGYDGSVDTIILMEIGA